MASNPVFSRIERETERGYAGFGNQGPQSPPPASRWPSSGQMTDRQLQDLYEQPAASAVQTGRLTLVLGFAIALKKTISVPLIVVYAVVEGLLVGSISAIYATRYEGIVTQAVLATLSVFAGMLLAYKVGLIKVTARFRRMVTMAIFGYMIFALVNLGYALVTHSAFGIGGTSPLGIGISIFAVGLASFSLALDFDAIERAIAAGAPQRYSWLLAHGLIVTLVWLYLEILRLLGRARSN